MPGMLGHPNGSEETNRILETLSHPHRRRLLFRLYEEDSSDAVEPRICYRNLPSFRTERTRIELHHSHLPKLEEDGYIRWNRDEEVVTKGKRWGDIEPFLDLVYTHLHELPPELRGTDSGDGTRTTQ